MYQLWNGSPFTNTTLAHIDKFGCMYSIYSTGFDLVFDLATVTICWTATTKYWPFLICIYLSTVKSTKDSLAVYFLNDILGFKLRHSLWCILLSKNCLFIMIYLFNFPIVTWTSDFHVNNILRRIKLNLNIDHFTWYILEELASMLILYDSFPMSEKSL